MPVGKNICFHVLYHYIKNKKIAMIFILLIGLSVAHVTWRVCAIMIRIHSQFVWIQFRILATCDRFLLPLYKYIIEGIVRYRAHEHFHPFLFVFVGGRRHSIHGMFAFDNLTLGIGFTRLYDISTTARIQLKAMRLTSILYLTHTYILQRDYTARLFIGGIFKVIQAIVIQYEPSSFPWFVSVQNK